MTNGEKFKEVFGISQVDEGELYAYVWLPNHDAAEISIEWWNAEYKELTTKKCTTCAYRKIDGKPHEMCKSCVCGDRYRQEPTTKNDLAVELISKADALALYCDKCGVYNCISKCSSYRAVEKMPSVAPQLSSELDKNSQKLEKDFGELDCISRADAIRVASGYCHPSNVAKELAKLPSITPIR